jgi:hypothetical protein
MGDLPESHMQYAGLQMRSESRLVDFMSGPLQRDLECLPGCGPASIDAMATAELFTLDQICGKFMVFDRDPTLMVQWLEDNGFAAGWSETATHAIAAKLHNLLAGMASDSSDEVPEEHMKYAGLQMRSETKLVDFLSGPLQRELTGMPGCGPASVKALNTAEIFTMDQLCGKFMMFDRDPALMVQWLEEIHFAAGWAETATHALAAKLHNLLD